MRSRIAFALVGFLALTGGCASPAKDVGKQKIGPVVPDQPHGGVPGGVTQTGGTTRPQGPAPGVVPSVQPGGAPTSYFAPRPRPASYNPACSA